MSTPTSSRTRPWPQLFLGLLLVGTGVVALLGLLGVIDITLGRLVSTWWPTVIIALGLAGIASVPRAWVGPSVLLVVGSLLQLDRLDVVDVSIWELVIPMLLILAGLTMLAHLARSSDGRVVNAAVLWWGTERRSSSPDFRGGNLSAVMGGVDVDLRSAGIIGRAEMSVFVLWGGVDIKVPPGWRVVLTGLPVLGGWTDKTTAPHDPDAPELVVHVTAIMGGVEVKN